MEKINKKLGTPLIIMSLVCVVANYFNVLAMLAFAVNLVVGCLVGVVAMMEVYHYQVCQGHEPGWFWLVFSAIFGVILVATFYATGANLMNEHLSLSLMTGLSPALLPVIGVFFGDIGRILFKSEASVI